MALPSKRAKLLEGVQERVLHHVPRILFRPDDAAGDGQQAAAVGADDLLVGRLVSRAKLGDKRRLIVHGSRAGHRLRLTRRFREAVREWQSVCNSGVAASFSRQATLNHVTGLI